MDRQIDVSIAMMTYFHEDYVARAIESVLSQDTQYTYEIVISDDCSQDRTKEILLEYKKRYPDRIVLNFNEKNLGISNNNYKTRCLCKGRYIATLSGDDYWIDNNKIQRQVEFLDNHPEYYAVATTIEGRYDNDETAFAIYPKRKYRGTTINLEQYLHGAMFGTNGMMMRNAYLTEEGKGFFLTVPKASPFIDDATECILVLMKGNIYISDISSVVYRVRRNSKGMHNFNTVNTAFQKCKKNVDLYNNLYKLLIPCPDLFYMYKDNVAISLVIAISKLNFNEFGALYSTIPAEYKRRYLLLRSLPRMFSLSLRKVMSMLERRQFN